MVVMVADRRAGTKTTPYPIEQRRPASHQSTGLIGAAGCGSSGCSLISVTSRIAVAIRFRMTASDSTASGRQPPSMEGECDRPRRGPAGQPFGEQVTQLGRCARLSRSTGDGGTPSSDSSGRPARFLVHNGLDLHLGPAATGVSGNSGIEFRGSV